MIDFSPPLPPLEFIAMGLLIGILGTGWCWALTGHYRRRMESAPKDKHAWYRARIQICRVNIWISLFLGFMLVLFGLIYYLLG